MIDYYKKLDDAARNGHIPKDIAATLHDFFLTYEEAVKENGFSTHDIQKILNTFLEFVIDQLAHPYPFEPYHKKITSPTDYYTFGLDLIRPLVDFEKSSLNGKEHLKTIEAALAKKENVILLANHQTEPDPQAISLILEKEHPQLAENIIFVAGHRVTTDPLAAPFSKGRNLLCIYSKRHVEFPPEQKEEKLLHNQTTMKQMVQLLSEGGKCIYVAPSGGRDRKDEHGNIAIAPFDPQSIEMFSLMAQKADKTTHFHTLALYTYDLLPPPSSIDKALGERRQAHSSPIHLAFGPEINMSEFPGSDCPDKKLRRVMRSDYIWQRVVNDYNNMFHT